MNIQTVIRHLEILGKIDEDYSHITSALIYDCENNKDKVKAMDFKSYKIKIKDIFLEFYF